MAKPNPFSTLRPADLDWLKANVTELTQALNGFRGERYLAALTLALTRLLRMRHAWIGEVIENHRVHALFFADRKSLDKPFTYALQSTPCQKVIAGLPTVIPCDVERLYPAETGWESYVGYPLHAADQRIIGLLAVADDGVLVGENRVSSLLNAMADRAAAELEVLKLSRTP